MWRAVHLHLNLFYFFKPCFLSFFSSSKEKAMATHSSTLAWKTPWAEEPGRLLSMGSHRVKHDWATSLSLFTFHALEKEMATHSNVLAWRIPGTGEPGGLPSMGSHRVGHDWSDLAAVASHPDFSHLDQTHLNYAHTPTKEMLHTENKYRIRF